MIQVREQYGNIYVRILDTWETFNMTMDKIRRIQHRTYKENTGEWMFPKESIGDLLLNFGNQIVWTQPLSEIVKGMQINNELVKQHLSWQNDDDFKTWRMKPYPYQKTGAHFLADRKQAAVFDGVGLGKTCQVLGAVQILMNKGEAKRTIIVTLSALVRQWAKEVEKFTGHKVVPVTGTTARRKKLIKGFAEREDIPFLIVNYETLKIDSCMDEIMKIPFDVAALDEAQKIKNGILDPLLDMKPSQNALACYKLKHIPNRFIATATPIQSRAEEIWSLYHFLSDDFFGSWEMFRERYCEYGRYGIRDYKNKAEMHSRIVPHFIRRTKNLPEIQQQLPQVAHDHVFLEMTPAQEKLEGILLGKIEDLKEEAKKVGSNGKIINGQMLSRDAAKEYYDGMIQGYTTFLLAVCDTPELLTMSDSQLAHKILAEAGVTEKDITKSPKIEHLLEFHKQLMHDEPDSKIVIFTRFERMARLLQEKIPDSLLYTGQMSDKEREWAKESFINDPTAKVFIGTEAASTGLNLQVANYMVHIDLPWEPTQLEQRNGRIDRTGNQFSNVTILYYLMADSYDEHLIELLEKKADLASSILEGNIGRKKINDFNKLAVERLMKNKAKRLAKRPSA